jgi:hypothetical protein
VCIVRGRKGVPHIVGQLLFKRIRIWHFNAVYEYKRNEKCSVCMIHTFLQVGLNLRGLCRKFYGSVVITVISCYHMSYGQHINVLKHFAYV